ncbi:hypothetical protein JCM19992_27920 [Thermostilla marina]
MSDSPNSEKKLHIDEDWKSQVEREKEELAKQQQQKAEAKDTGKPLDDPPLPPPTLTELAGNLAMEAMIYLGLLPNPATGGPTVMLNRARHVIDSIALLQEKTEGRRTLEETEALEQILHELRMGFIAAQSRDKDAPSDSTPNSQGQ